MFAKSGFSFADFQFGAQNCQPALNLNRIGPPMRHKAQRGRPSLCMSPRLTQNPCYRAFFYFFPLRFVILGIPFPGVILNKKWFASWEYENSKKLAFLILACIARYVQKMPIFSA
jgi:hypothetical protein